MIWFTGSLVVANTNCSEDLDDECEFDSVAIVTTICGMAGIFQLACALLRVGKFAWILSDILVSGYTTAAAIHVAISQLDSLFGLDLESYSGVLVIPYVNITQFKLIAFEIVMFNLYCRR